MNGPNRNNFIIAIALSIVVLFGWQYFIAAPQLERQQQEAAAQAEQAALQQAANLPGADVQPAAPLEIVLEDRGDALAVTAAARVPIVTPAVTGSINLNGGLIDDLTLNQYFNTVDVDDPNRSNIVLLSPSNAAGAFFAEIGWSATGLPASNTWQWTAAGGATLTPATPVVLTYDFGIGLVFTRTVSIDDRYMFTVADEVTNNGTAAVQVRPYGRVNRTGEITTLPQGSFILHEGLIGYLDEGLIDVDYTQLENEPGNQLDYAGATGGWLGITDKYWAATLIPDPASPFSATFLQVDPNDAAPRHQAQFTGTTQTVEPGVTVQVTNRLFAGAKEVEILDDYNAQYNLNNFNYLIDWGLFYFLTQPMFYALDFFYNLVGNFGVAILLVTVLIKGIFFPLASRSYRSMAGMRKVGPEMTKIRERYKDDRAKQQQAMLELYKREKINPISGCWPILIQIPVFFALYKVLFVTIEMRHQPFFGWIQDLSAPDPTSIFNLFGLLPYDVPIFLAIGVWPVLMGITMWVQMRLSPQTPGAPVIIFHILPIVFTFMLASFPAGLVIYWTWNNLLSVAQQTLIMKRNGVEVNLFGNIRDSFRKKKKPETANTNAKVK